jgi:hypothetical protein
LGRVRTALSPALSAQLDQASVAVGKEAVTGISRVERGAALGPECQKRARLVTRLNVNHPS